ncbi:hypothetical protein [Verrucomicrobium spinosum]|uniref:hypothetical protein n=1 Tax=Verrucomicrobium spinosum TaxID=2736 RepID=UPI0009466841|nr:hypothetical protein [Verrucomicrobium spinosum]
MKKKLPPSPGKDFTVCSIAWDLEAVQNHTHAGFRHIPDEIIYRRFFQFLDFIQRHGFTVRTIAETLSEITTATSLRNSDLTMMAFGSFNTPNLAGPTVSTRTPTRKRNGLSSNAGIGATNSFRPRPLNEASHRI